MKRLRILHLEDNILDAELVAASLAGGGIDAEVTRVETEGGFRSAMAAQWFDLILADYSLPSYNGVSALELVQRHVVPVPFIFVTGTLGEELAIEILKRGATDYVLKHRLERLAHSVRRALREAEEQAELRKAGEELKRTLAREQVARAAAVEASRAKDQFLAMLSHELRTPLTPVLMAVTALLDDPGLGAEVRPTLEMIQDNVALEARLIDDLLDVERIVHGRMSYNRKVVDVHDLIRRSLDICRGEILGGGLRESLDLAARTHHVDADPARVQQILWNLIKNAVKFSPGGGSLRVRTRNELVGGDGDGKGSTRLIVEVSDTGVGIEADLLPVIFDAFKQGEILDRRRFGGLGLGLAISRSLAEAQGGGLSAASAGEGRGATFTLDLPAVPDPSTRPDEPPPITPAASKPDGLKILMVEDDPTTLAIMARLLRRTGHSVTTADRLAKALEAADADAFDLVISDIGLPDGSGLDLMPRLRARSALPGIALSGFGTDQDIRRSRDAGFAVHLTKPVDFSKLQATIRTVVAGSR